MSVWDEPQRWDSLKRTDGCPICQRGAPRDVIAEHGSVWVTAGKEAPLPSYVCVVAKQHVVEPFELPGPDLEAFWREAMRVARALVELVQPTKMNYEIHGNTIPHLHMHLFPRFSDDPYVGGPIDPAKAVFTRTDGELDRLRQALGPEKSGSPPASGPSDQSQ